ncbi:MAG TPA: mechanosensitive ion channel domain-containing protein [Acidimicrobiia bacterium]|nr:mechanosensitive ion channel domain-containing protein [Acidimicrobiia bacterium]
MPAPGAIWIGSGVPRLVAAAASGSGLTDACGSPNQRNWLCTTTYRITGSKDAAEAADAVSKPLRIVIVLLLAYVAVRILKRVIRRIAARLQDDGTLSLLRRRVGGPEPSPTAALRRAQRAETISSVLRNVTAVVIWTIALLIVLGELGVDLAPLIAGAGIVGVALGFGAQTIVRDYLAGLFVVLEDQYGVGDVIDAGAATGTVEWVSLRLTRLRDAEGVIWHVPNGEIKRVGNRSQRREGEAVELAPPPTETPPDPL